MDVAKELGSIERGDQVASGTILARGPQQPVNIVLPGKPESVGLDPDFWVLSEKTSTRKL